MDYLDTNWYILREISRFAQSGYELDLNDIKEYLVFQDIIQLQIKWDIWNKKEIPAQQDILRDLRKSVLADITRTIDRMRQTLTYMISVRKGYLK